MKFQQAPEELSTVCPGEGAWLSQARLLLAAGSLPLSTSSQDNWRFGWGLKDSDLPLTQDSTVLVSAPYHTQLGH